VPFDLCNALRFISVALVWDVLQFHTHLDLEMFQLSSIIFSLLKLLHILIYPESEEKFELLANGVPMLTTTAPKRHSMLSSKSTLSSVTLEDSPGDPLGSLGRW